ncbi:MAG: ABC transporter ATP-binding protein, partial [Anaerolineales bacterium]
NFGPNNLGLPAAEIQARVDEAVAFFDLAALMENHPYRLAFPLRKLVAMASIYAMGPEVFVLDEPTTGQDHAGYQLVRRLVQRLREQKKTVVIVSHDMALLAETADRLVAMWAAEVIAVGTPREIFSNDDVMQRTKLHPPQITQFSRRRWPGDSQRLSLTVAEAVAHLTGEH